MSKTVNHPDYYGGDTTYEAIKVIEAWGLGFSLGNAVKYISRAGKKDPDALLEDLRKASWYLQREIDRLAAEKHPLPDSGPAEHQPRCPAHGRSQCKACSQNPYPHLCGCSYFGETGMHWDTCAGRVRGILPTADLMERATGGINVSIPQNV